MPGWGGDDMWFSICGWPVLSFRLFKSEHRILAETRGGRGGVVLNQQNTTPLLGVVFGKVSQCCRLTGGKPG